MVQSIALLGSTGSIGRQTLEVAKHLGLRVVALAAGRNVEAIEEQARAVRPEFVAMGNEAAAAELRLRLHDTGVKVFAGVDGICEMIGQLSCDMLLNAIVGGVGLRPTLATVERGIPLALANKESLVCGGELVMARLREKGGLLLPVDSEHSAIFQSLLAGNRKELRRILLTASGGPFFGRKKEELAHLTAAEALRHPTWSMGAKITVDSASMMNKGFEAIEAAHLFGVPVSQIEVLVQRESIVHSLVEFCDGSVIAQMSRPDMRECIQYALTYPRRAPGLTPPLDLAAIGCLHFAEPDYGVFPLLPLAYRASEAGGVVPAAMNAANDLAVAAFLEGKLDFGGLCETVQSVTENYIGRPTEATAPLTLEAILAATEEATSLATEMIETLPTL